MNHLKRDGKLADGVEKNINASSIMQYGKDWKKVEQYVRTRSGSQVRSHAQKFFNKLQKGSNAAAHEGSGEGQGRRQEHSETEFDFEREVNSEITPSTPLELVSLIKKQEKEEGGKINLFQLRKTLEEHGQSQEKPTKKEAILPQASSFKSMSNILSAYQEVNNGKDQTHQDQSFFISITKKYKRLFRQVEDFDRLIDLHAANEQPHSEFSQHRKRSFTLPEGNEVSEEEIDEKIESIKKKINAEGREERQGREGRQKRERKDSESSIQFMPPPLGRLTTIQEHPLQEDQTSFRAIAQQERGEQKEKNDVNPYQ